VSGQINAAGSLTYQRHWPLLCGPAATAGGPQYAEMAIFGTSRDIEIMIGSFCVIAFRER
jgi:hypothetical protein